MKLDLPAVQSENSLRSCINSLLINLLADAWEYRFNNFYINFQWLGRKKKEKERLKIHRLKNGNDDLFVQEEMALSHTYAQRAYNCLLTPRRVILHLWNDEPVRNNYSSFA